AVSTSEVPAAPVTTGGVPTAGVPTSPVTTGGVEVAIGGSNGALGLIAVSGRDTGGFEAMELDFLHAVANVVAAAAERQAAQSALVHLSMHDPLTGLPNRELLTEGLARALERAGEAEVAVLLVDLDRFKVVNDGLGHGVGDTLLLAVAERLSTEQRTGDLIARLGGDEFVAVAEHVQDVDEARQLAGQLLSVLRRPFEVHGRQLEVTASVGVVLGRRGDDPMRLLRDADAAMYRAKERGRDRVEVFEASLHSQAMSLLDLEHDLRRAVERGEFALVYQPELDLRTGAVRAAEALLRWEHPVRGRVSPADFVAMAEETGLILTIGEWALRRACLDRARWARALGGLAPVVAVNVSVRQLAEGDLVGTVTRVLRETRTDPDQLHLEITETALMVEEAMTTLHELHRLGVHLTIDDFGTGYSSLAYLRRLPVDTLKIDRSFVGGLQDGLDDATIVEAVVGMAHALGKEAVAEGVETPLQAAALEELNCDLGQGFYWSRPLSAGALAEFAAAHPRLPRPRVAGDLSQRGNLGAKSHHLGSVE
ncbi:MAG: putative bifunctional diguanylate cyclase/phosphodiesterase, partial [Mycobacteriales bacterium]